MARIVQPDAAGVAQAVDALRRGGLIGMPTETVYGLAADATNDTAVRRIFSVKRRPETHPLIVHVAEPLELGNLTAEVTPLTRALTATFWPGPLTVIVRANQNVSRAVTGGRDTVAVRCPAHPVAQAVIRALGRPVAAPSANRFGAVSPTTATHVVADLGDDVDIVLDGGECDVGLESTIVDCTSASLEVLRPGAVTVEQLHTLAATTSDPAWQRVTDGTASESRAPGMMQSHYAPRARLVLHEPSERFDADGSPVLDFSRNLPTAAHTLYAQLRALDAGHVALAHIVLPPPGGLGQAIRDRLTKAAAGR
jgi:L-threonylcarbamoyladenylate synthase